MSSPSDQTVLVTGASGFVASYIIKAFLECGYCVRGTVRSNASAIGIKDALSEHASRLSFAIVPDIASPNAFNEAIKGVSGVIHTASPFVLTIEDNERDVLLPAINGTLNVLNAAKKFNPDISRVVITSSFASILDLDQGMRPGYVYTEDDWNPYTYEAAKATPHGPVAYCASKALAEKAAWDWMEQHKPKFSLTTICPPYIFGPLLNTPSSMSKLNESAEVIYRLFNGSITEVPATDFAAFADVRDVAQAHLQGFEKPEAANQRFLVAGGQFGYQASADIIRKNVPELKNRVLEGKPGSGAEEKTYIANGSKAERVLGLKYHSLETSITDLASNLVALEGKLAA